MLRVSAKTFIKQHVLEKRGEQRRTLQHTDEGVREDLLTASSRGGNLLDSVLPPTRAYACFLS